MSLSTQTKAKPLIICRKLMCRVSMPVDRHFVLFVNFTAHTQTVNVTCYCETLRKLQCTIQNKIDGMLQEGILLIHDNA